MRVSDPPFLCKWTLMMRPSCTRHRKLLKGAGFKANYFDTASGEQYWISGPKKDGSDRLYGEAVPVGIDEDVRAEYWTEIRGLPDRAGRPLANR